MLFILFSVLLYSYLFIYFISSYALLLFILFIYLFYFQLCIYFIFNFKLVIFILFKLSPVLSKLYIFKVLTLILISFYLVII